MNIDKAFVSLIIQTQDVDLFKTAIKSVKPNLLEGVERNVYSWIMQYYRDSRGKLPSKTALKIQFKGYDLYKNVTDSIDFFILKIKERRDLQLLTQYITKIGNSLYTQDVEKAKDLYKELGQKIVDEDEEEKTTIKDSLINRQRQYLETKKRGGKLGYYIGIPSIDRHTGGLFNEFVIVSGRQGVGKTFLVLNMAVNIWKEIEKPVLIVSNEMPTEQIYQRIDSNIAKINLSRYRKGLLTKEEEVKLRNLGEEYKKLSDLYVISGAGKSAYDIEYEIIAINPGLVLIDGIYLTDMGKNDIIQDTIAASRAYQRINKKYNVPIIATSQVTNDNATKYARALQEDADIVLSMFQNQHLKDANLMKLFFYKIRNESNDLEVYMNWDFDTWDFSEAEETEIDYNISE